MGDRPPFTCPFCGMVSHKTSNPFVDWELARWRAAFFAASAARDAKITALLAELRAEAEATKDDG